jgi:hypothetical protein
MPVLAYDDVVVHGDPGRLCDLDDLPRHLDSTFLLDAHISRRLYVNQ